MLLLGAESPSVLCVALEGGTVGAGGPAGGAVARAGSAWVAAEGLLRDLVVLSHLKGEREKTN